ncbi:MAG: terpene cyclase/mutase family protein, partial [Phycisphaerae bacterium]|nr:terpene cyclase/mutase family protein [Phycisphaerae bacterium]
MRRILPLCLVLLYTGSLDAQVKFSDEDVKKAIERGAEYLWSLQRPDGSWPPFRGETYPAGPGALACYALLESGVNPQDERMQKALQWLAGTYSNQTYSVSLRCNVWKAANRSTADKYIENLRQESAQIADSTGDGSFTYSCSGSPATGGDNSNSQFGLLALWAARQNELPIKKSVWKLCRDHWIRTQNPDGGWPYRKSAGSVSSGTMTCAGLASLYVCVDNLQARNFIDQRATTDVGLLRRIQRGLNWLDKNYEATSSGYYMYAIERVGLASGYKYFNKIDWYKRGATSLLNSQGANGSWTGGYGPLVETAFKMLFLIRGQHSV